VPPRAVSGEEAAQGHDEADRGDQIEESAKAVGHRLPCRPLFLALEHLQHPLRAMKPPKMLTAAKVTRQNPMILAKLLLSGPAAISAPTMITLDTRVGTLISGECNAGSPRQTT